MFTEIELLRLVSITNATTDNLCPMKCSVDEYRTISRRLTLMEKHGWITRSRRNGWRWSLTPKGQEVLNANAT